MPIEPAATRGAPTLADAMLAVVAAAGSFGLLRLVTATLPIDEVFGHPLILYRSRVALRIWLPAIASPWPFALALMALRRGDLDPSRPGLAASLIACVALPLAAILVVASPAEDKSLAFRSSYVLEQASTAIGSLVAGAWLGLRFARPRGARPGPTWLDRAGHLVGVAWIVSFASDQASSILFLFRVL